VAHAADAVIEAVNAPSLDKEGRNMTDLLFYRENDGLAAVGHVTNGHYVNTDTQNFTANWSQIVVVGINTEGSFSGEENVS